MGSVAAPPASSITLLTLEQIKLLANDYCVNTGGGTGHEEQQQQGEQQGHQQKEPPRSGPCYPQSKRFRSGNSKNEQAALGMGAICALGYNEQSSVNHQAASLAKMFMADLGDSARERHTHDDLENFYLDTREIWMSTQVFGNQSRQRPFAEVFFALVKDLKVVRVINDVDLEWNKNRNNEGTDLQAARLAELFVEKMGDQARTKTTRGDLEKLYLDTCKMWMPHDVWEDENLQRPFARVLYAMSYHMKIVRVKDRQNLIWNQPGKEPMENVQTTTEPAQIGAIVKWNSVRGFGFIKPSNATASADLYFHVSGLVDREGSVKVGDLVTYRRKFCHRMGKYKAVEIRLAACQKKANEFATLQTQDKEAFAQTSRTASARLLSSSKAHRCDNHRHPAAFTNLIKQAATIEALLCVHRAYVSHLNHIYLGAGPHVTSTCRASQTY
eukprot:gnl/TRDRNA2_/TRDRNA2_165290_c2_seq7.p1 gnl/TRDRNA2_/TRDRNA2_165290_c2~~gnl/TRDRNA2_/TRDRNA2_165290_c2_seq7.p1  ORF type:complete len:475 (-),score=73.37 gnl/TRDRNA2_/TRDRNA2_165290_c2_seq7:18-1343(-)